MKPSLRNLTVASSALALASTALATNGDNLIGIGPISRAMGGVGIAAPQDAISAVFANPAAMCFTPGCDYAEVNFAGTLFMPHVKAELDLAGPPPFNQSIRAESKENVYAIPAIGVSVPLDPERRRWRFGLAAYGVTGLGVDYRGTALDQIVATGFPPPNDQAPLIQGEYTSLMIMKFAPSLSYQVAPNLSFGAALHLDYATLDLRNGSSPTYGVGATVGTLYRPFEHFSLGLTYTSPQATDFKNAVAYPPTGSHDLKLESPHIVGLGAAYSFLDDRLLVEANGKWLNWGSAAGYADFGWEDQWVFNVGVQFAAVPKKLFLRAGYNYGKNPVSTSNGWGAGAHNVQGMMFPDYYYETFRIIGFPAVVEHHLTGGVGYAFSEKFELNLGYMHAFSKSVSETGTYMGLFPASLKSTLSEDSLEIGLTWRF